MARSDISCWRGASFLERWQSGRMRRIRNPVYGYAVTWVRIPPSPPDTQSAPSWGVLRIWRRGWTNPLGSTKLFGTILDSRRLAPQREGQWRLCFGEGRGFFGTHE